MKATPHPVVQRAVLPIILIAFVVAGILYGLSSPFLEVSDEVRHYAMVEQLAQGKGLPVQDPARHGFYEQEGSQPPLYYELMALVALPFDRSDFMQLAQFNPHARLGRADATNNWNQLIHTPAENFPWHGTVLVVQIIRLLGVLMGAVTVACTYLIARELTPDWPWARFVPALAAAFTAFNPMFVFISASVNNDTLAAMLSALSLLTGVRIIKGNLTWCNAALLGLLLAGAALTKSSALALVAVLPLAIWVSECIRGRAAERELWRGGEGERGRLTSTVWPSLLRPLSKLLLTGVQVIGIAGWWYVRNAQLYNGDLTGTVMMATIAGARDHPPSLWQLLGEWGGFREAYWGLFGAVNIPMDQRIYSAFDALVVLAGIGLLLLLGDVARNCRASRRIAMQRVEGSSAVRQRGMWMPLLAQTRQFVLPALACVSVYAVALVALMHWTSMTLASQGRLLFPVIAVISTFLALGLCRLVDGISKIKTPVTRPVGTLLRYSLAGVPVCMAVLAFVSPFTYIRPAYAVPDVYDGKDSMPAGARGTELRYGDSILWLGYSVDSPRVRPGDEFGVTLYWQALKPMGVNYSAFIRLYGRNDSELFLLDTYPGGGMYQTTLWQPGQVIADHYRLRIADTVTAEQQLPTSLQLDVGFWDLQTEQFLQTYTPDGTPTGRQRYEAGALAWPGTAPSPHYPALSQAQIGAMQTSQVGNTLTFTVTWVAQSDFHEDYTVFVHLFDQNGQKVAQTDGRAAGGRFSALWWRKGDVIVDPHILTLPAALPGGDYTIRYGLYKPTSGERMPAFNAQGQPIPNAELSVPVTIR